MALPKIRYGDVFEIQTSKGFGYFQCIKESPSYESELIRIFKGVYRDVDEAQIEILVEKEESFYIQFPLKYGVKKKVIRYVGNYLVPKTVEIPKFFRDKHIVKGEFVSWHIIDGETLMIQSVKELTAEQRRLSPAGMWNDTLLAERIENGWTLKDWI